MRKKMKEKKKREDYFKHMQEWLLVSMLFITVGLFSVGCGRQTAMEYELTFSGTMQASGVLSFLGYEINVYQDEASNSCGDCVDQPVHLYAGATEKEAVQAVADAVNRANDVWQVKEQGEKSIVLVEKEAGTVKKKDITDLQIPLGMTISDNCGNSCTGTENSSVQGQNKTIYDLDGDEVRVPVDPQTLAAVYGPSYEALVVLGQEDKIVVCADVQKDNFPWASKIFSRLDQLPCLENVHSSVNVEELLTYQPDLVFSFSRPNEVKQLDAAGVCAIEGTTTQTLADVPKQLLFYAHALGNGAVEHAEKYETYFNQKYESVTARTKKLSERERPMVYYAGIDLLTTYGSYSDIPELIEAAGGTAVTKELEAGNHTQINFEQLAVWNPDYIFIDHGGINDGESVEQMMQEAYADSRYNKIQAVAKKQIYLSPSGVFYWDMGLQKILLLMNVAKTIHPELFSDLDMTQEVMDFYQEFYQYPLTKQQAEQILNRQNP